VDRVKSRMRGRTCRLETTPYKNKEREQKSRDKHIGVSLSLPKLVASAQTPRWGRGGTWLRDT